MKSSCEFFLRLTKSSAMKEYFFSLLFSCPGFALMVSYLSYSWYLQTGDGPEEEERCFGGWGHPKWSDNGLKSRREVCGRGL